MGTYRELVSKGKDAYLDALEDTGWFRYSLLTKDEIRERLFGVKDPEDYVFYLYNVWFDAEGFEDDDAYRSLLEQILGALGLEKSGLSVLYDKEQNYVTIEIKTKHHTYNYSIALDEHGDWVDGDLIDSFINNEVLPGELEERRLMVLPPSDQTVQFVFIPEGVFRKAREKGVIPGEDYFMKGI